MSKWKSVVAGGLVAAALLQSEHESPGSVGRGAQELRGAVMPAAQEVLGAAGDAVTAVRTEVGRQNLGAVLSPPTTAGLGAVNPDNPQGIPSQVKP